jgi:hypothetical protein
LSGKLKSEQFLDDATDNIEKNKEDSKTTQYQSPNINNLIDSYTQLTESFRESFFDYLKLPTDDIDVFRPRWIKYMKASIDNYLEFQHKMIMLYPQICNAYFKNTLM